jgi:hypothetical protein
VSVSAREHIDAVVLLLETTSMVVTVGEAPDDPVPPLLVVWPSPALGVTDTLDDPIADALVSFQVTSIGESAEQALWASDKAYAAINRMVPTFTGRVCRPIWGDDPPQPVRRDDAVNPPMFVAISLWSLRSSAT